MGRTGGCRLVDLVSRVLSLVEAEVLAAYQLDLLARIEHQLRSVHKTMRQIEKLRSSQHRVGPELSNGQRGETLERLYTELDALEGELQMQREMFMTCTGLSTRCRTC